MSDFFLKNTGISYSKVPSILFALRKSKKLTVSQAYLALDLADYSHNNETPDFSISFKEMTTRTGLNSRTLMDAISRLIEIGLISHTAQNKPQFKNQYTWNTAFLSIGRKNLLTGDSENYYGGLVKNTKAPLYNLLSLYIYSFYTSFKSSFRSFFDETNPDGSPCFYVYRNFKGDNKTKNVTREEAWENAFKSVLKSTHTNPLVNLYIFILSNPELNDVRFPTAFIKSEISNATKIYLFRKDAGFPDYLESDEALMEKLKNDPKFKKFLTHDPKWKGGNHDSIRELH